MDQEINKVAKDFYRDLYNVPEARDLLNEFLNMNRAGLGEDK